MIFVVDIGNSNIVLGGIDDEKIHFIGRIATDRKKTGLAYAIDIKNVMDIFEINRSDVDGCIISSVVPQITNTVKAATEQIFRKETMVLKAGSKTGLNICIDDPAEMGADRVADAVAATNEYPLPLAIVDMGTATTISVVDADRRVIGGAIFPGVQVSIDALTERASKLNGISLEPPGNVIGRNTVDCMRSGILYGTAAMLDGILDRMEEELGEKLTVIATGGMSSYILSYCRRKIISDEYLLLKGLKLIYEKNV
ncbi:MAG: type III pantothenate kinase [Eubacterium sp.]|nr:type III pantothenate kinase [Eubacterium sp.]